MNEHGYKQIFDPHYSLECWDGQKSHLLKDFYSTIWQILSTQQAQLSLPVEKAMMNKYVPFVLLKQNLTLLFSVCMIFGLWQSAYMRQRPRLCPLLKININKYLIFESVSQLINDIPLISTV